MLKRLIGDVSAAGLRRESCKSHRRLQLGATGFLLRSTSCFRTKHLKAHGLSAVDWLLWDHQKAEEL